MYDSPYMVHKKYNVCKKFWYYLLPKVKTETERKTCIVIPTFFHIGKTTRISPTAIQTSMTPLPAWMWDAASLSHRTSLLLSWSASLLLGYCRKGLDSHSLCDSTSPPWGKTMYPGLAGVLSPPLRTQFPWGFCLGSHLVCLEIQNLSGSPSLSVGGHWRTQSLRKPKSSYQYARKGTGPGQDSTWIALSGYLQSLN